MWKWLYHTNLKTCQKVWLKVWVVGKLPFSAAVVGCSVGAALGAAVLPSLPQGGYDGPQDYLVPGAPLVGSGNGGYIGDVSGGQAGGGFGASPSGGGSFYSPGFGGGGGFSPVLEPPVFSPQPTFPGGGSPSGPTSPVPQNPRVTVYEPSTGPTLLTAIVFLLLFKKKLK